jgi:hypothetical protein
MEPTPHMLRLLKEGKAVKTIARIIGEEELKKVSPDIASKALSFLKTAS